MLPGSPEAARGRCCFGREMARPVSKKCCFRVIMVFLVDCSCMGPSKRNFDLNHDSGFEFGLLSMMQPLFPILFEYTLDLLYVSCGFTKNVQTILILNSSIHSRSWHCA